MNKVFLGGTIYMVKINDHEQWYIPNVGNEKKGE